MKTILKPLVALALVAGMNLPHSVDAQTIIKRISCKNTNASNRLQIHANSSGQNVRFTYQVVRDGCKPKQTALGGNHWLRIVEPGGSGSSQVLRLGKFTRAVTDIAPSASVIEIYFTPPAGGRASGTFDYVLTIH